MSDIIARVTAFLRDLPPHVDVTVNGENLRGLLADCAAMVKVQAAIVDVQRPHLELALRGLGGFLRAASNKDKVMGSEQERNEFVAYLEAAEEDGRDIYDKVETILAGRRVH